MFHQPGCQAAQSRLPVDNDIGGHDSRVQAIGGGPGSFEAPGQFIGEEDIGQLGLAVSLEPAVAAGEVNVVEMNAADFVGHRGQGDYPAFGRDDEVQEQIGEKEMAKIIDAEIQLISIFGQLPPGSKDPGIVD